MCLGALPYGGPTPEQLAYKCGAGGKLGNPRSRESDISRSAMPSTKAEDCAVWSQKIK
jgi:hypothetical protein